MKPLIAFFKKLTRHTEKHPAHNSRNPNVDWFKILMVLSIFFVIVFIAGVSLFIAINNGVIWKGNISYAPVQPTVNRSSIDNVDSHFQERENTVQTLITNPIETVDPAI